ncbi:MAG: class I SAM-dependent methyltransferase [Candidatus Altiarchaeota archaeon]|nr:class I SAM-dependent methyltransferase [Candidatus Altiarchaeota archaeon]
MDKTTATPRKIIKNLPKALSNPAATLEIFWRRFFPIGLTPKDPEAFRIATWSYGKLRRENITDVFPKISDVEVRIQQTYNRTIGTSIDVYELIVLLSIVKHLDARNILEIGTYDGNTTLNLAVNTVSDARITTVDLPDDESIELALNVPKICGNAEKKDKYREQYRGTKYEGKINQVYCDSAKVDWKKLSTPFDLAFIDGCHYLDYIRLDTENALKHLGKNGVIVWHDYGMSKDVSAVVDEYSEKMVVKAIRGTRLAIGFKKA